MTFQLNYFVLLEEVFNNLLFLTLSRIFLEEGAPDASPALHPWPHCGPGPSSLSWSLPEPPADFQVSSLQAGPEPVLGHSLPWAQLMCAPRKKGKEMKVLTYST